MTLKKIFLATALFAASATASAAIISAPASLGNTLDSLSKEGTNVTTAFTSAYDIANDQWNLDEMWALSGSGVGSAVLMFELAGDPTANTFGIYDLNNIGTTLEIFSGSDSSTSGGLSGTSSATTALSSGFIGSDLYFYTDLTGFSDKTIFSSSTFGFYLKTNSTTFYSQAALNANGDDQLATYRGNDSLQIDGNNNGVYGTLTSNNFVLAWEDIQYSTSDKDFNDMVVMIESITPVPAPGALALLGLGLFGLAFASRRKA
jgi:hypothetical protein